MRGTAALLALGLALGCAGAGGVEKSELPDAPVALLERPEEEALRRLDALRDLEKRQSPSQKEGVAVLEKLDAAFGGAPELEHRLRTFQGQLVLLDPRTGSTRRLEGAPPQARPAAWAPDRRRLFLTGVWRDRRQVFAWDRESERLEIVTAGPAHHVHGCLAAGDRLVVTEVESESLAGAPSRILVSRPGGGAPVALGPAGFHLAVACSPVRPEVAFSRIAPDEGRPRLFAQALDPPGEPREVGAGTSPVFTPDGEWIVYVGMTTRGSRLYRVRPDGSGRTPLGAGVSDEASPAVSPDGRYVAFVVSDADRRERVWVRRIDGSGDRPLLSAGDGSWPVW